ncbi:hypothetical protein [Mesorhizobium silamurunense]|nr:hypothetical protein [Mesorhizobium silamurunense]
MARIVKDPLYLFLLAFSRFFRPISVTTGNAFTAISQARQKGEKPKAAAI